MTPPKPATARVEPWMFIIAQTERGWDVRGHSGDNVLPMTSYPNAQKAAARLLQLMEIGLPVTPQDWPEQVLLGEIE